MHKKRLKKRITFSCKWVRINYILFPVWDEIDAATEYTQSGNDHFLAYIPSFHHPIMMEKLDQGIHAQPFHSIYHHLAKLWCSLQLRGQIQIHSHLFLLYHYMDFVDKTVSNLCQAALLYRCELPLQAKVLN